MGYNEHRTSRETVFSVKDVMQSDGNSWKIDTFEEAITSQIITLKVIICPELVVHELKAHKSARFRTVPV